MKSSLALICLLTLTACGAKVSLKEAPKKEPYTFSIKKDGFKCDLKGEKDFKQIFIEKNEEKGKWVKFYNFINESKLSNAVMASFEDLQIFGFELKEYNDDQGKFFVGESILHFVKSVEAPNGTEITNISGRMIVDEKMNGIIQKKYTLRQVDEQNPVIITDYEFWADIENCQPFKATWLGK